MAPAFRVIRSIFWTLGTASVLVLWAFVAGRRTHPRTSAMARRREDDRRGRSRSGAILLVDDDLSTRALVATWLHAAGYVVRTARNGREALALLHDEAPSVLIADLNMPVMDGAELRGRQLHMPMVSAIPFILLSGAHDAASIAQTLGIVDVIRKPCEPDELLRVVDGHCHRRLRTAS